MANVLMHGPAFDGSGKTVEREVPECDVIAFKQSGYVVGEMPTEEAKDAKPKSKAKTGTDEK